MSFETNNFKWRGIKLSVSHSKELFVNVHLLYICFSYKKCFINYVLSVNLSPDSNPEKLSAEETWKTREAERGQWMRTARQKDHPCMETRTKLPRQSRAADSLPSQMQLILSSSKNQYLTPVPGTSTSQRSHLTLQKSVNGTHIPRQIIEVMVYAVEVTCDLPTCPF